MWPLVLLPMAIGAALILVIVIGGRRDPLAPGKGVIEQRKEVDQGPAPQGSLPPPGDRFRFV